MNPIKFEPGEDGQSPELSENQTLMTARILEILSEIMLNGMDEVIKEEVVAKLENILSPKATTEEDCSNPKTLKHQLEMLLESEVIKASPSSSNTNHELGFRRCADVLLESEVIKMSPSTSNTDQELGVRDFKRQRIMSPHVVTHHTTDLLPSHNCSKVTSSPCPLNKWGGFLVAPGLNKTSSSGESCHCQRSEVSEARTKKESIITTEQLREHLSSLICSSSDQKSDLDGINNKCQLCGFGSLLYAPKLMYCSSCSKPIKPNMNFFYTPEEDLAHICFCTFCVTHARGGFIYAMEKRISKAILLKRKNDEADEEPWVECDKCKRWQHEICGLYNRKNDPEGNLPYTCLKCLLEELESGQCNAPPLTTALFRAKDLKRTTLSDHIERRLSTSLKREREDRSKKLGKPIDEVPGAEDLFVRVVLSMKKILTVNQRLLDVLRDENHPSEFPYTEKSILLFQKIDGIDVCIFNLYVQEYGSDCSRPNQRCAYISYLDSVNYFRPNIKTVAEESLRTFVYHQIVIGYLDYIKMRGFITCYLWACVPKKGDEYILYCHPETQKMPKPDRLRQWYHSMTKKAANEGIVVNCTTLYDRFFVQIGGLNRKMTAARLPYFCGDYWPSAVDNRLDDIEKERKEEAKKEAKRGFTKNTIKAMGLSKPSDIAKTDVLLMKKLEKVFSDYKEDFIVIDLQLICSNCIEPILSGEYWSYNDRRNSRLCERCHTFYTMISRKENPLPAEVSVDVPSDTIDKDETLDNDVGQNRNQFVAFCQSNHYQFDTLRRAKHSSMMILHHLRHLAQPTDWKTSCHICHKEEDKATKFWSCKICSVKVCTPCHLQKGGSCHIHKLDPPDHLVALRDSERAKLVKTLEHANRCHASPCSDPFCGKMKSIFIHAETCNVQANNGCRTCQKAWYALYSHSEQCTDLHCQMPYCKLLKKKAAMVKRTKTPEGELKLKKL